MHEAKHSKRALLSLSAIMTGMACLAQSITTNGIVKDASGEPLIGVTVSVKGTNQMAVTDMDGRFTLTGVKQGSNIQFSYVGYDEKVQKAASNMNVLLKESDKTINEVVVIGYGTVKKRDLTGSVSSVSKDALTANPVANVAEALQGKLAGVAVSSQDGRPGADVSIRVRGGGSISQSNEPLYVVDGFPVTSINDIPADQIVSIDVLKDASSTAIYGARGANGVILITTKAAESGKISVSYNGYYQAKWAAKRFKTLNAQQYVKSVWAYAATPGTGGSADDIAKYFGLGAKYGNHYDEYASMTAHDYTDDMLRTASSWNHNVNLSGGSDKSKFTLAVNYAKDDGIKINSDFERLGLNFKFNQRLAKGLDFLMDLRYSTIEVNGTDGWATSRGSLLSAAYTYRPIDTPLGTDDYTLFGMGSSNIDPSQNPAAVTQTLYNNNKFQRLRANFALQWEITKGLTLRTEFGYGKMWRDAKYYDDGSITSSYTKGYKYATWSKTEGNNWRSVTTANWQVQGLGENHKLSVLLGNEEIYRKDDKTTLSGAGYPSGDAWTRKRVFGMMNMGDATKYPSENYYLPEMGVAQTTASFFGRVNYTLLDRYLLTATMRADGSSKFGPNHHWGYFPAAAIAWRVIDEPFMKGASKWLDNLKLRLSYGTSGADNISSSLWHETWTSSNGVWNGNSVQYYKPSGLKENPDLKWETTISRNIGIDFGFLNRINGTLDFYWNTTKDLLMRQEIDSSTGYSYQYTNIGQTSNKGIELGLNVSLARSKNFNLNLNLTYNYNFNNIDKLQGGNDILYGSGWASGTLMPGNDYVLKEGSPVGVIRGYKSAGFYTLDDFDYSNGVYTLKKGVADIQSNVFTNYPKPAELQVPTGQSTFPGALKVVDVDNNGIVNESDVVELGSITPHHTGGFAFTGNYKNFDFTANFTYQIGGNVYNASAMCEYTGGKESGIGKNKRDFISDCFQLYDVRNGELVAVTDPTELAQLNKNATRPVPYYEANTVLSTFIEDASFLRLSNITVGYSLPKSLLKKAYIQSARVYVTGGNLFCITGYSGLDPEVSSNSSAGSSGYPTPGLDYGSYPRARTFTVGLNLTF